MGEYLLKAAIPVDWLDDLASPAIGVTSLAAGTCLDTAPLIISDPVPCAPVSAKIRVNGRDGIVRADRLNEAMPGWNPTLALDATGQNASKEVGIAQ